VIVRCNIPIVLHLFIGKLRKSIDVATRDNKIVMLDSLSVVRLVRELILYDREEWRLVDNPLFTEPFTEWTRRIAAELLDTMPEP
jgi:hypothetical protein